MQSRKKWKRRYYKERKRRKEADKATWQTYEDYQDAGKKMFEYAEQVEQLETNNKKLIEKLEKVIKKNNEFEFMPLQVETAYNNYYKLGKMDLAQEILGIAKGEKE